MFKIQSLLKTKIVTKLLIQLDVTALPPQLSYLHAFNVVISFFVVVYYHVDLNLLFALVLKHSISEQLFTYNIGGRQPTHALGQIAHPCLQAYHQNELIEK
jgi:hypothetical protein